MNLSNSALDKYLTCPRLYKHHYIDRYRTKKVSSALIFGIAIHESLEVLLNERDIEAALSFFSDLMTRHLDEDNLTLFKSDFDINTVDPETRKKLELMDEDSYEYTRLYGIMSLHNKGKMLITQFYQEFLPRITKVYGLEVEVNIKDKKGNKVVGYIDAIVQMDDGKDYILDFKSSNASYSDKKILESRQLHLYAFCAEKNLLHEQYGIEKIENIAYVVLRKDLDHKANLKDIQFKSCKVQQDVIDLVMSDFNDTISNIDLKKFDKVKRKNTCKYMFGKPCVYFDLCHNNKRIEDIEELYIEERRTNGRKK